MNTQSKSGQILHDIKKELPHYEKKIASLQERIGKGERDPVEARTVAILEHELSLKYIDRPETQNGVLMPFRGLAPSTWISVGDKAIPGKYRIQVRCGIVAQ